MVGFFSRYIAIPVILVSVLIIVIVVFKRHWLWRKLNEKIYGPRGRNTGSHNIIKNKSITLIDFLICKAKRSLMIYIEFSFVMFVLFLPWFCIVFVLREYVWTISCWMIINQQWINQSYLILIGFLCGISGDEKWKVDVVCYVWCGGEINISVFSLYS